MTINKQSANDSAGHTGNWEESVTRFLVDTPDYFLRHPELLAALAIPHSEAGRAVSLVERQVKVLRDQNVTLGRQLHQLIQNARDNDQLAERVQRIALAIIDAAALDDLFDTARDMLRQEFGLDAVAIRLTGTPCPATARDGGSAESANAPSLARGPRLDPIGENAGAVFRPQSRSEFVAPDDAALDRLERHLAERNGQPLCGPVPDETVVRSLFGATAESIGSAAIIGLSRRGLHGVLLLGSQDAQRFRPDMGTLYLARLGDLLAAGIARYLTTAVDKRSGAA
jgi:hypothetical protein